MHRTNMTGWWLYTWDHELCLSSVTWIVYVEVYITALNIIIFGLCYYPICNYVVFICIPLFRVPSRGGFGGLNPHQNHLDPHFIWPWVQWTLCIDFSQAGSNFSYGILKSLICWWPHSSFVLYNVIRKYNICSRIKCKHVTCAQYDPASTPERVNLLLQMKTK